MITLSAGLSYLDLHFLGTPRIIATAVLHGTAGVALVDPGPSSTLPALRAELERAGIRLADVRALLLTHIHLDHAGAAGTLVRERPDLRVYVHEKGAPHLVDPAKLLASAARLYGADMDRLWGEVRPVPREAIVMLAGGERLTAAGRTLDVAYTPGHASHHVSYLAADAGVAFVGDTAGVRLPATTHAEFAEHAEKTGGSAGFASAARVRRGAYIVPPTPPPDIDLEAWRDSLARIRAWGADTLFITHFGPCAPAAVHLAEMADHLDFTSGLVKTSLAMPIEDADREAWFTNELRRELRKHMADSDAQAYEIAGRFDLSWRGLARYWRKKA